MAEFFTQWGIEILFAISTAIAVGICKYFASKAKAYQKLIEEKELTETEKVFDKKLDPIYEELEDLRAYIRTTETTEKTHMNLIIASYRFRLIQLCKTLLHANQMTQDEYDQLSEFYKVYIGLGGNGQAKEYYERTIKLPIVE